MSMTGEVRWTEGMFLRPQHFQQADLHHAAQRHTLARLLSPYPWGVRRLEIDADALENEVVRIQRCELVFPDGLWFRYPEAGEIRDRSFREAFLPTLEAMRVYLATRNLDQPDAASQRYVSRRESCRDLYDPGSTATVDYVVPRAEIVFTNDPEDERLAGFQAVCVAEVRRTGRAAPRYELSRRFIPPAVSCEASPLLLTLTRQVHDQVAAAARNLGSHRRERGAEGLAAGAGDLEQLLALLALNQYAPALQHQLAHGGGHPYDLFQLLVQLRGCLTTFSGAEESVDFREYVHNDLYPSFAPVVESIRRLLEQLMPTHYTEIELEREEHNFYAPIEEEVFREATAFVLALRGGGTTEEIKSRMDVAKITSMRDMVDLRKFAVDRGVPTRYESVPPAEIPRLADHTYFAVETGHARWDKVRKDSTFCLFFSDAPQGMEARLYAVLRRGRKS